jgi:hypothetical protein
MQQLLLLKLTKYESSKDSLCRSFRVDARMRVMLRVGMIAATPASFAAGYSRYAPEDVSPDVRLGDRTTPTIALNLIYLLIPTAEVQS